VREEGMAGSGWKKRALLGEEERGRRKSLGE
jgi:hypothetical protein